MLETERNMFSPSSSVATPHSGEKMNGGASSAVEEDDSPLLALDKLVASATAGAAGRLGDTAAHHQRHIAATGSDENSGNVANQASSLAAMGAGGHSAPSAGPTTPADSSRGQHTGTYTTTAENGISHSQQQHAQNAHQQQAQTHLGVGIGGGAGKPPTTGGASRKSTAGSGGRSDWSSGGASGPATVAATLSSASSSSPGQMSRDGSGVGVAAELAALNSGAAAASGAPKLPSAPQSSGAAAAALAASPGGDAANSSFLVPRNPRDTVPASSPQRRSRSVTRSGASPGGGGRSVGATSQASATSGAGGGGGAAAPPPAPGGGGGVPANVSPSRSNEASSPLNDAQSSSYAQLSIPSSPQGSGAGVAYLVDTTGTPLNSSNAGTPASVASASAAASAASPRSRSSDYVRRTDNNDNEEQAMFEQRLYEDEYGVAVRKINSNGRSQLRYVKCAPLVSSHHGDTGAFGPGSPAPHGRHHHGERGAGASVASATKSVTSSTARSVSSLMGRISRSGRSSRRGDRSRSGRDRSVSVERSRAGVDIETPGGRQHPVSDSPSQASGAGGGYGGLVADDPELMRNLLSTAPGRRRLALTWGNKKKVRLGLDRFVCVRKGKTTERTRRNPCHSARLLSLITDDRANPSLDIEAPTKLDRDKFARAFARFLGVPLEADPAADEASDVGNASVDLNKKRGSSRKKKERFSAAHSAPDLSPSVKSSLRSASTTSGAGAAPQTPEREAGLLPAMSHSPSASEDLKFTFNKDLPVDPHLYNAPSLGGVGGKDAPSSSGASGSLNASRASSSGVELLSDAAMKNLTTVGRRNDDEDEVEPELLLPQVGGQGQGGKISAPASAAPTNATLNNSTRNSLDPVGPDGRHLHHHSSSGKSPVAAADIKVAKAAADAHDEEDDAGTDVSSLTQGFDQEIVEELHQALTELRSELEASRAEAARAVKVAEQAIQSAESCTSNDWNSTVTHKAAEAAAKAQKRSAEAMAKQREAEERLAKERKSAQFWRKQAEEGEEEKGGLRTRAAAAEVQRTAASSELRGERARAREDARRLREERRRSERARAEELATAAERNRLLEAELDKARRELSARSREAKSLHETLTEIKNNPAVVEKGDRRKSKLGFGKKKKSSSSRGQSLLLSSDADSVGMQSPPRPAASKTSVSSSGASASADPPINAQSLIKVHLDAAALKTELALLRRTAAEELAALPAEGRAWAERAASAAQDARNEAEALRAKLARETAMRRKLGDEVGELRGNVRVMCRPRSKTMALTMGEEAAAVSQEDGILTPMSHDVLQMRRDCGLAPSGDTAELPLPLSFEFDHIFASGDTQKDVYAEVEKLVLSALDGYNICVMAYGPRGCGKTHTLIGDLSVSLGDGAGSHNAAVSIKEYGVHFLTAAQLFSMAEARRDRYHDAVSVTIVEVHNERLRDLLAGTNIGEERGEAQGGDLIPDKPKRKGKGQAEEDSQPGNSTGSKSGGNKSGGGKLEIRTTYDGDTVVQGLISVPVENFDDICRVWQECLLERAARLAERGLDRDDYEAESHVIATLNVVSTNTATGVGTVGKIQFADLAAADLVPKRSPNAAAGSKAPPPNAAKHTPMESVLSNIHQRTGSSNGGEHRTAASTATPTPFPEWKFANRSLSALLDVVTSRNQFSRSVPYRNSTVTHLLRDSLTSDTKVLLLLCVSDDGDDVQETASALRFAAQMRRVMIGRATKHTISLA